MPAASPRRGNSLFIERAGNGPQRLPCVAHLVNSPHQGGPRGFKYQIPIYTSAVAKRNCPGREGALLSSCPPSSSSRPGSFLILANHNIQKRSSQIARGQVRCVDLFRNGSKCDSRLLTCRSKQAQHGFDIFRYVAALPKQNSRDDALV